MPLDPGDVVVAVPMTNPRLPDDIADAMDATEAETVEGVLSTKWVNPAGLSASTLDRSSSMSRGGIESELKLPRDAVWIPANQMFAYAAGPTLGTVGTGQGIAQAWLLDPAVNESVGFTAKLPYRWKIASWYLVWTTSTTTTGVAVFQWVQNRQYDGSVLGAAIDVGGLSAAAPAAANTVKIARLDDSPTSQAGFEQCRLDRLATNVADTMPTDIAVLGVFAIPSPAGGLATRIRPAKGTMTPVPNGMSGRFSWNTQSINTDYLTTADGRTYHVYIDSLTEHGMITQRTAKRNDFAVADIDSWFGPRGNDSHNASVVAVDSEGYVHVSGNHHATPLKYIRSVRPHDITEWAAPGMVGTSETEVTYPTFVTLPDGRLLFFYRSGTSESGVMILNVYNAVTQTWTRVGTIADGTATSMNPYWQRIAVDRDTGRIHVFWIWRTAGGLASASNDLSYAYCDPGDLAAWFKSDGTPYGALPITKATVEVIVDTSDNSGMFNSNGADVDTAGRPHTAFTFFDASGDTQYRHVWFDGVTWQNEQVTAWTHTMVLTGSTVDLSISRPAVVCDDSGRTYIIGRNNVDVPGKIIAFDVTPGGTQRQITLVEGDWETWEPAFDSRAARDLNLLMMPVVATLIGGLTSANDERTWQNMPAYVLAVDMSEL